MSEARDFLAEALSSDFESKHDRYDRKVTMALTTAMNVRVPLSLKSGVGLDWFNEVIAPEEIAFGAVKLSNPVQLHTIVAKNGDKFKKTELWREYENLRCDWADSRFALVFDHHGDQIGDLVMHNITSMQPDFDSDSWFLVFHVKDEGTFYIHTFKSFLDRFGQQYREG